MFQSSQFSDQKNQSGFKQGINYNEQVTHMNIRMMKQLKVSFNDKNEILYNNKQITLIKLLARKEDTYEKDGKGIIVINDDSGQEKLIVMFQEGDYIKDMFQIVQTEDKKTSYFNFLLRVRNNRDTINYDIMNIAKINQSGQIISHLQNIIHQDCKQNQMRSSNFKQTQIKIDEEEEQFQQTQITLADKILNYIKTITQQQGSVSIARQSIFNEFSKIENLQEIKKSIKELLDNGNILLGQGGENTFMLAD
ncbi:unnamed protein product [Paramecium sonneborni]|uniref:Uncharacterized protein n=1 Tax=Paramecium sonneborni TaxID=65129 RepID=A0A8S1KRX7_9CILI|nr:unnamed protein product [Paramecium sonneborni]